MRQVSALAIVVGLVSGALGAWVSVQLSGEVGAAPPPPSAQAVREQNLDGGGFIRVHEQGTANVNVTNGSIPVSGTVNLGNLPSVQDVNVVSATLPTGRLITLSMGAFVGSISSSEPVNISDCRLISITSRGGRVGPVHSASLDGTHFEEVDVVAFGGKRYAPSDADSNVFNIPVAMPFLSVLVNSPSPGSSTPEAWIWCVP